MNRNQLQFCLDSKESDIDIKPDIKALSEDLVSLESEIPETLFHGMKEFIADNPAWDQYSLMSSALACFLYQNGCGERAVTERYLDDLFTRSNC